MKAQIHPKYFETKVTCSCGNTFTTGSTVPEIKVDVCSACHPFYTGQMKFIDTAGRVDAFRAKQAQASSQVVSKAQRREEKRLQKAEEEQARPESLSELRKVAKRKN